MPDGTIHVTGNHGGHDESPVDVEVSKILILSDQLKFRI